MPVHYQRSEWQHVFLGARSPSKRSILKAISNKRLKQLKLTATAIEINGYEYRNKRILPLKSKFVRLKLTTRHIENDVTSYWNLEHEPLESWGFGPVMSRKFQYKKGSTTNPLNNRRCRAGTVWQNVQDWLFRLVTVNCPGIFDNIRTKMLPWVNKHLYHLFFL